MIVSNIPIDAVAGETVTVSVNSFLAESAFVALVTNEQLAHFQRDAEGDDDSVLLSTTAQHRASRASPTVEFLIPSNGTWHIVYQPHEVGGIPDVSVRRVA